MDVHDDWQLRVGSRAGGAGDAQVETIFAYGVGFGKEGRDGRERLGTCWARGGGVYDGAGGREERGGWGEARGGGEADVEVVLDFGF